MRIKKRLQINVAVSVLTALVICLMLFMALHRVNRALEASDIADNIVKSVFERSTFREDYVRTNSERAKVQWFARHEQIGGLLKSAAEKFTDSEDKKTLDEMVKDQESTGKLFSAIVKNRENAGSDPASVTLSQEVESRLLTQLSMRLYDKTMHARRLQETGSGMVNASLRQAGGGIAGVLAIVIAVAVFSSWTMNRAITDRVRRLRDGAAVIGGGDLDHHIDIKGDDEFGELSVEFNAMTARLRGSYHDLEKENEERKQAEDQLRKTAAELLAANTDLDHSRRAAINLMEDALDARRQAEEAAAGLRQSEEKFRGLFNWMGEAIQLCELVWDEQGRPVDNILLDVNPAYEKETGLTREQVVGRRISEILPVVEQVWLDRYGEILRTRKPIHFEEYNASVDRWFDVFASPMEGNQFAVVFGNITDRKQAEETMRQSEEKLRALADSIPNLAWWANADGYITWYNRRWYEYSGTTPEQMEGWGWQSVHDPNELPKVLERWQASIASGELFEMTFPLRGADGVYRSFLTRGFPMKDAAGRVLQWFGTNTDVSPLKRAEEQIKASLAEKEVMLREIHHRVKNNLQVISSLVSLQADGSTDETVREVFRDMIYRVRSMALVHEKLYQSADMASIDFAEYARSLLNYLWRAHASAATAVRLTFNLQPLSLPVDTAVPCGLILNELAGNALKHAFRGRAEGEVAVSLQGTAEGHFSLSVADNGVGLPEGLDWRLARSLGLRLVQMLAGQLNATVEVSGGEGTEFRITFDVSAKKLSPALDGKG